jgi:hypothetical protein
MAPLNARLDRLLVSMGDRQGPMLRAREDTTGGSEGGLASPGEESTLAMNESVQGDRMSLSESRMRRAFVGPSGSDGVGRSMPSPAVPVASPARWPRSR